MHKFNYRVAGKKLLSRFGYSHKDNRYIARRNAEYFNEGPAAQRKMKYNTKRLAKKCPHKRWEDTGYGGPESGCMAGHCKDCGYSFHHTLY